MEEERCPDTCHKCDEGTNLKMCPDLDKGPVQPGYWETLENETYLLGIKLRRWEWMQTTKDKIKRWKTMGWM